jgi:hypothetical protein
MKYVISWNERPLNVPPAPDSKAWATPAVN